MDNNGQDNVQFDVENLNGGSGSDTLSGSSEANTINGGDGADTWQMQCRNAATLFGREPPRLVRSILQRFGQSQRDDALLAGEIRDRAGHPQRTMHGARRHAAPIHGVGDEPRARGIERAVPA